MAVTLYVTCGLPACGKSTWAARQPGVMVVSADAMRTTGKSASGTFMAVHNRVRHHLMAGDVVADTCAVRQRDRLALQALGRAAGARCVLVVFDALVMVCVERDRERPPHERMPDAYPWLDNDALVRAVVDSGARAERWDQYITVRS